MPAITCPSPEPQLRQIILHGALRRRYGREFRFAVASPAEAVRALCANFRGFQSELATAAERGVRYAVFVGKRNIGESELAMQGSAPIRIAPVLVGSKRGGLLQTIAGVALVVVGVVLDYFSFGTAGNFFITTGIGLTLGGIAQLLTPTPKTKSQQGNSSAIFGSPVNVTAQGVPVPVLLGGPLLCGSVVVSAGIDVDQVNVDAPVAALTVDHGVGAHPLLVNFDGSASTPVSGSIARFDFDFGDGTKASQSAGTNQAGILSGAVISHTYLIAGSYVATLKVTNSGGTTSPAAGLTVTVS